MSGMATLEEAEAARKAHQHRLAALGAHAIEIQRKSDLSGYELVVHFAVPPSSDVPSSLVTTSAGRTAMVPVRTVTRPA